ncbi:MAG: co-chaperone GroES family protein [Candidatus Marinimicrobia bacterium]|nr:co-chaperone GroES family protein [Candidatus Neomarinimicrobiota bacterium]
MPGKLENLKVIGDRVLIYPDSGQDRTSSGLYLPPTVTEQENVQSGYVVAVGPGTPLADTENENDVWQHLDSGKTRYIPLEVEIGDYALYLKKFAVDIKYQDEKYIIVPMSGILVVERDDEQLDLSKIIK